MDYVRLGSTGLKVSRLCLGTMTYGTPAWRPWVLDEADEPAVHQAGAGARHQLLRHRRHVFAGRQRGGRRPRAPRHGVARRGRDRDEGVLPVSDRAQWPRAVAQAHLRGHRRARSAGWASTTSTSTRSTASIRETPIEETLEALHDVVKAGKARYIGASSMYAWQFAKMLYTQQRHGWTRFVSMQNHYNLVYREEEREMMPLCRAEGVGRDSVEPARARLPGRQPSARAEGRHPRATSTTTSGTRSTTPTRTTTSSIGSFEVAQAKGRAAHPGGAGVGAAAAQRDRTHHRRLEARAARPARGRPRRQPVGRRGSGC